MLVKEGFKTPVQRRCRTMRRHVSRLDFLHLTGAFCNVEPDSSSSGTHLGVAQYTVSGSDLISAQDDITAAPAYLWPVTDSDYLPRHFWHRLFRVALQALALFSLLVAMLAPFFDHSYAQRDPHHAHIFLGAVDAAALSDHQHSSPAEHVSRRNGETALLNATGIFSVPGAGDWATQGLHAPLLLVLALPIAFFAAAMGRFKRLPYDTVLVCRQPFLPPPDKPPRF